VKFVSANTNQNEISFPLLDQICHSLQKYKTRINEKTAEIFADIIEKLGDGIQKLETISSAVASMDVVICKCVVAEKYHYCCPTIQSASSSFVEAKGMRHILIEQLQQHELYVANDVSLNGDGILLFGTNAVGKTSLMRALGICVIMAQSGMFVPCQSFVYKPYQSIFSRILGNDNLFKGLSTFAMEMSELRVILRQANENSLILGDELCSGTESESATSIFMASLIKLCEKKSSFLFATHFHEIVDKEEIQSLPLRLCHLKVHYDKETDNLIYDRTIQDGPGPRNYGLEVCKSLYMDEAFLETAYKLRSKYFVENEGSLNYKKSPYNARKIKGICEICGDENIKTHEIHHLQMQQCADETGYIENRFHKNHPANLASVCQKCHDDMHLSPLTDNGSTVSKKKKKGTKGYVIE
jgi:DNA mismatch repair protein MutS